MVEWAVEVKSDDLTFISECIFRGCWDTSCGFDMGYRR